MGSDGERGAICSALGAGAPITDCELLGKVDGVEGALEPEDPKPVVLVVLRHKLQRVRSFELRRERCFDFAPQHGQRDRMAASLTVRLRRMVAIEFGT